MIKQEEARNKRYLQSKLDAKKEAENFKKKQMCQIALQDWFQRKKKEPHEAFDRLAQHQTRQLKG
jgi:hypothetical protein